MNKKDLCYIFIIITILVTGIGLAVFFYKTRGENKSNASNVRENLSKDEALLKDLLKQIKQNKIPIIDTFIDEKFVEKILYEDVKLKDLKNVVLVNAANEEFKPYTGGLNLGISKFVENRGGITNDQWFNLRQLIDTRNLNNRIYLSSYKFGLILHIDGLKASDIKKENLELKDVSSFIRNLVLTGLNNKIFDFKNHVFIVPYISNAYYAQDGEDIKGVKFTREEFALKAKIGVCHAILDYSKSGKTNKIIFNIKN